mmetsp:Transcript_6249/g.26468  ORF Transcript_6249/g.26468 Transcript_6249/m.26468 type:complete len:112 (-) Transcript_6249:3619-3954(-)
MPRVLRPRQTSLLLFSLALVDVNLAWKLTSNKERAFLLHRLLEEIRAQVLRVDVPTAIPSGNRTPRPRLNRQGGENILRLDCKHGWLRQSEISDGISDGLRNGENRLIAVD